MTLRTGYDGSSFAPQSPYVEALTLGPQNVTVLGDGVFTEVVELK